MKVLAYELPGGVCAGIVSCYQCQTKLCVGDPIAYHELPEFSIFEPRRGFKIVKFCTVECKQTFLAGFDMDGMMKEMNWETVKRLICQ